MLQYLTGLPATTCWRHMWWP